MIKLQTAGGSTVQVEPGSHKTITRQAALWAWDVILVVLVTRREMGIVKCNVQLVSVSTVADCDQCSHLLGVLAGNTPT